MDEEVLFYVHKGNSKTKRVRVMKKGLTVAAALVLVIGIYNVPPVNAVANTIISKIVYQYSGEDKELDLEMDEQTGLKCISKEWKKYNTLSNIEDELGIDVLTSSKECTMGNNHIFYDPIINDAGDFTAVLISDPIYEIGDLCNVEIETYPNANDANKISYDIGEKYKSPIGMQIAVVVNMDGYKNGWLGSVYGRDYNYSQQEGYQNVEIYEMKGIGEKAFITLYNRGDEGEGIGPQAWGCRDANISDMTMAVFTHKGIEYRYYGAVNINVMKEFLDTLE